MGTPAGGSKAHETLKKKLGLEGYSEYMANIGARGGKAQVPKGFSVTRKRAPFANELHHRGNLGVKDADRTTGTN